MPGVNLTQSIDEKRAQTKGSGDNARLTLVGVFLLVLGTWGAVRGGITYFDKKINDQNALIEEKKLSLTGPMVNDVADIEARLHLIETTGKRVVYPRSVLAGLESVLLPSNRLTSFKYDDKEKRVSITGIAPGYKEVSQQIMAIKASPKFSQVRVLLMTQEKEPGTGISFDIEMVWNTQTQ